MASGWDLSDSLDLETLFEPTSDEEAIADEEEPADEAAAVARLRTGLNELALSYWRQLAALRASTLFVPDSDPSAAKGATVLVRGMKNKAAGKGAKKHFSGELGGVPYSVPVDERLGALLKTVTATQKEWGWKASATLDLVGVAVKATTPTKKAPVPKLEISVKALRVPDQFLVVDHPDAGPYVVGLAAAQARLERFRDAPHIPRVINPEDILPVLAKALADYDIETFKLLWVSDTVPGMHKRRFKQFVKIHDACAGKISFDRFDPSQSPDKYPDCRNVRMFVKREYTNGTVGYSPLVLVREDGDWRIQRGII